MVVVGLCSSVRFGRLMRSAQPAPAEVGERVGTLAARLGLRNLPTVWMLPVRVSPLVWVGLGCRPRLVLPEELWGRLEAVQQDAVLAHELAHLKRRDHWVRRLEATVLGLYWWDPVAWWARREIEHAEERACDAWVLWAVPGAGSAYALALVATAAFLAPERRPLPAGACGVGRLVPLKRRLQMVVHDSAKAPISRNALRAFFVLGIAGLLLLPALALSTPARARVSAANSQEEKPTTTEALPQNTEPKPKAVIEKAERSRRPPRMPDELGVMHPVVREIGDHIDLAELTKLTARRVEVSAGVSGQIINVNCRLGQAVKKGNTLFEIDGRSYRAELAKAEAGVRRAQAQLKRSQAESALKGRQDTTPPPASVQQSVPSEEAAADLMAAEADRELARLKLESTRVLAPITGIVNKIKGQLGENVRASDAVVTVVVLDPLEATFYMEAESGLFLIRARNAASRNGAKRPTCPSFLACGAKRGSRTAARSISWTPRFSRSAKQRSVVEPSSPTLTASFRREWMPACAW